MENNDNRSSDDTRLSPVAESRKSRRRFIRSAAVGSAVLLTLGNRAAWGSQSYGQNWGWKKSAKKESFDKLCLSATVYESWRNGDPSSVAHHKKEVDKFGEYWRSGKYKQFTKGYGEDKQYCVKIPTRKDNWW
ncbi:MAG: hypothetical protein R3E73_03670 [Porticoccaceae bacterium]|nr:hypothetical protein [Pseudomonadales bacterium]MCP5172702.1 hypothetical protein [Pseudomonadales bacterium]MCP5302176.1 hypothetical protein [Pseudomonadales bacterium]